MQRASIEELQERWDRYRATVLAGFEADREQARKSIDNIRTSEKEKENKRK